MGSSTTSFRVPPRLLGAVDAAARRRGLTRTSVTCEALEAWLVAEGEPAVPAIVAEIDALVDRLDGGPGDLSTRSEEILRERFRAGRRRTC